MDDAVRRTGSASAPGVEMRVVDYDRFEPGEGPLAILNSDALSRGEPVAAYIGELDAYAASLPVAAATGETIALAASRCSRPRT